MYVINMQMYILQNDYYYQCASDTPISSCYIAIKLCIGYVEEIFQARIVMKLLAVKIIKDIYYFLSSALMIHTYINMLHITICGC